MRHLGHKDIYRTSVSEINGTVKRCDRSQTVWKIKRQQVNHN